MVVSDTQNSCVLAHAIIPLMTLMIFTGCTANSAVFFLFIAGESMAPTPGDNMESPTPGDNMESPTPGDNMESSTTPGEMDPSDGMAAFPLPYPSQGSSFPLPLPGTFQCMPTVCVC